MADLTDDRLDELLDDFRADVPDLPDRAHADLRATVLAATAAPGGPTAVRPFTAATPADRRRARLGLLGAAAVVGALAVGAVVFVPHHAQIPVGTQPSSTHLKVVGLPTMPARPINHAGELSAHVSRPTLKRGQYLYVRQVYTEFATSVSDGGTRTDEQWVTYDPADQWRDYTTSTGSPHAGNSGNIPDDERATGDQLKNGIPTQLRSLPTDPVALYQWLAKKYEHEENAIAKAATFIFGFLYEDFEIPPATKAAMYVVLGYLPGIDVSRTTLPDRTEVTVLTRIADEERVQFFVDPRDGRVAGARIFAATDQNGVEAGYLLFTHVSTQSVVDSIESRP